MVDNVEVLTQSSASTCDEKKDTMDLDVSPPCFAIIDVFRGQQTPAFHELLEKNNNHCIAVPTNCTDKLQPLDI